MGDYCPECGRPRATPQEATVAFVGASMIQNLARRVAAKRPSLGSFAHSAVRHGAVAASAHAPFCLASGAPACRLAAERPPDAPPPEPAGPGEPDVVYEDYEP